MIDVLRDALESMVYQFGNPTVKDDQPAIGTGGLSALEEAFEALGWDDPHIIEHPVWCDALRNDGTRCPQQVTSGVGTPDGYKHYCSTHYIEMIVHAEGHSA